MQPTVAGKRHDAIDVFLERVLLLYPTLDPMVEAAVDRITHLTKALDRSAERTFAAFGLNKGEFKVLLRLHSCEGGGPMTAGELSETLSLSSGAMTNRLDGLEERALVTRRRDPDDRRSVLVHITDHGIEVLGAAVAAQGEQERQLLSVLSEPELERLNGLLRKLMLADEDARTEASA